MSTVRPATSLQKHTTLCRVRSILQMLKKLKLFQMVNAEKHSKGHSADPKHESLFTDLGEYGCICEKNV